MVLSRDWHELEKCGSCQLVVHGQTTNQIKLALQTLLKETKVSKRGLQKV